ncbi:MAG: Molybdenum ABC transporter permease protein [Anaerolineae bacterium 49_20]|nr:MAG: Molybdenum ABC transporter permease protein [Anaerolineae bacterium 49_20]
MNKMHEVAKYEYTRHVNNKAFWITLFAVPAGILLIMLLSVVITFASIDTDPVGYVDQAGLIKQPQVQPEKTSFFEPFIPLIPYADETSARWAAEDGQIQGYFVIPQGYTDSYQLIYYFNKPLSSEIRTEVDTLIRTNLLAGETIPNFERLTEGSHFTQASLDGTRIVGENEAAKIIIPMVVSILFVIAVMSSGGYLLQALVEEKENRTMEIMVTSVSPNQLMAGKIIGNLSVGLTQLLAWMVVAAAVLIGFGDRIPFMQNLQIPWGELILSLLLMLPAFVFTSALMAIIGSTVTESQEASQVTGLITLPIFLPYFFLSFILQNPNGTFARILSFFPMSAPLAMSTRIAITNVPSWEIILVFVIMILFCLLTIWLAGKAFRQGMLQYSKRVPLKQLLKKEAGRE